MSSVLAPKPLFRDPIHDGAADPTVVWNPLERKWYMFYTNRRANVPSLQGVSWCHGTEIGLAVSEDCAHWQYAGVADIPYGEGEYSYWAPEVIEYEGTFHMYLTFVPGMHKDWSGDREIVHFTSSDLNMWQFQSRLELTSQRVIDAAVCRIPDQRWALWYKDEDHESHTYICFSDNLYDWTGGELAEGSIHCEGPNVFHWRDRYWLIVDCWQGLAVFHSQDCLSWTRQEEHLLQEPGAGLDDMATGRHADVVVKEDRAYIFYFTHPGRLAEDKDEGTYPYRRSSIQIAELLQKEGKLICDRNAETYI